MLPYQQKHLQIKDFVFKESVPHNSGFKIQFNRGAAARWAGCFYVAVPKIGSVFTTSTKEMFTDYGVSPSWVTSLMSARKLDWSVAESLFVGCVAHVDANLKAVQICKQYYYQKEIQEERLKVEKIIRGQQRPFRKIDAVDKWLEQYKVLKDRYVFLCLDGKSQTGKTRFAANLTSADKFLNIDCSSATEPDLRIFDRHQHDVVLFDEARPEMILRVKKLAQASVDQVRLGQSATNVNSYVVWFHRVKLVVASNVWASQLKQCSPEDAAWLIKNSVYVFVDSPLHE